MAKRFSDKVFVKIYCPACSEVKEVEVYGSLAPAPSGCGNPVICPDCGGEWVVVFYPGSDS